MILTGQKGDSVKINFFTPTHYSLPELVRNGFLAWIQKFVMNDDEFYLDPKYFWVTFLLTY